VLDALDASGRGKRSNNRPTADTREMRRAELGFSELKANGFP
jgi:hypothetical protein